MDAYNLAADWKLTVQERRCWSAIVSKRGGVATHGFIFFDAFGYNDLDESGIAQIRANASRINRKAGYPVVKNVHGTGYRLTEGALRRLGLKGPCPSCGRTEGDA